MEAILKSIALRTSVLQEIHEMELDNIHDEDYLADLYAKWHQFLFKCDVDLYSNITDIKRVEMENADALTKSVQWLKQDQRQRTLRVSFCFNTKRTSNAIVGKAKEPFWIKSCVHQRYRLAQAF